MIDIDGKALGELADIAKKAFVADLTSAHAIEELVKKAAKFPARKR